MTASIFTLKSGKRGVSGIAGYYLEPTTGGYYASGKSGFEPPGVWWGLGAEALGLTGDVEGASLAHLLAGKSPDGKTQLVKIQTKKKAFAPKIEVNLITAVKLDNGGQAKGEMPNEAAEQTGRSSPKNSKARVTHVPGIDISISSCKSLSAVWALADASLKKRIENIYLNGIKEGFSFLEQNSPLARTGKAGCDQQYAKLIVAIFRHSTARNNQDPQLHFHCVIPNMVKHLEGRKWSKLNTLEVHRWVRTLGPLIRNNIAHELTKQLGLELHQPVQENGKQAGWFEVTHVPESLRKHWSSRSEEIDKLAALLPGTKTSAKAREYANLLSRHPKGEQLSPDELAIKWQKEAKSHRFGQSSIQGLLHRAKVVNDASIALGNAITDAVSEISKEYAHFEKRKLIQVVSEKLQTGQVNGAQVVAGVTQAINERQHVLTLTDSKGRQTLTTPQMWKLEEALLQNIGELSKQTGAVVSQRVVERAIKNRKTIRPEQAEAARHLLQSSGAIRNLTGIAGAGKSYCLDAVREAFEKAGYTVIGGALSGVAKEELRAQANIKSRTVASYLHHLDKPLKKQIAERIKHDIRQICRAAHGKKTYQKDIPKLNKKTVVILDEAGMIGTRSMARMVHHVKKAGATLILAGDTRQLSPIDAGGPFQRIVQEVSAANLTQNIRLKDKADVRVAEQIRDGKAEEAIKDLIKRDRFKVAETREASAKQLLDDWARDGGAKKPERSIILTQTRAEAQKINRICQLERFLQGELGKRFIHVGADKVHENDRIMFHQALRIKGLENGYRGTVVKIDEFRKQCTILLDQKPVALPGTIYSGNEVTLTFEQLAQSKTTLSYSATTHKMQGQTVDQTYVLVGGPMTSRELIYVQATRAREFTKFYVDRAHAGEEYQQIQEEMIRSRMKDLAHDQDRQIS